MPDFQSCAYEYLYGPRNKSLQWQYGWNGSVTGIPHDYHRQISASGCLALCGSGPDYYPWADVSSTVTTWVLPILGVLLQAPFESNAFWATVFTIARWIGSPIASMSYILWNIKVTGKCAILVDMALPYDIPIPDPDTEAGENYSSVRDSFYILTTMNQFTMKPHASLPREAEGLLRIVLFSKDLRLVNSDRSLRMRRHELASKMRKSRKRGVVPVFISTVWFLFSLGISVQSAFGLLGENATAHDLALGLLLGWLPVNILAGIVDRNFTSSDDVRTSINKLIDKVCEALGDEANRKEYLDTFAQQPPENQRKLTARVQAISEQSANMTDFFVGFAGQGRVRWHMGAAHSILTDVERNYIAERGRAWMTFEDEARTMLVLGEGDGLVWVDPRQFWQIAASLLVVIGCIAGAFVLSFATPTVGLGCRSGGYLIFGIIATFCLFLELLLWWTEHPVRWRQELRRRMSLHPSYSGVEGHIIKWAGASGSAFARFIDALDTRATELVIKVQQWYRHLRRSPDIWDRQYRRMRERLKRRIEKRSRWSWKEWSDRFVFRPLECANVAWLIYIVSAQTMGAYVTCQCEASLWGDWPSGGYIDFTQYLKSSAPWLKGIWIAASTVSVAIMSLSMIYIVTEWCLQSHLSTDDYENAAAGLRRVRQFRRATYPYRFVVDAIIRSLKFLILKCCHCKPRRFAHSKSLRGYSTSSHSSADDDEPSLGISSSIDQRGRRSRRGTDNAMTGPLTTLTGNVMNPNRGRTSVVWTKDITYHPYLPAWSGLRRTDITRNAVQSHAMSMSRRSPLPPTTRDGPDGNLLPPPVPSAASDAGSNTSSGFGHGFPRNYTFGQRNPGLPRLEVSLDPAKAAATASNASGSALELLPLSAPATIENSAVHRPSTPLREPSRRFAPPHLPGHSARSISIERKPLVSRPSAEKSETEPDLDASRKDWYGQSSPHRLDWANISSDERSSPAGADQEAERPGTAGTDWSGNEGFTNRPRGQSGAYLEVGTGSPTGRRRSTSGSSAGSPGGERRESESPGAERLARLPSLHFSHTGAWFDDENSK